MADPEHIARLQQGSQLWNQWRTAHPEISPDLEEAQLDGSNLSASDLSNANLSRASLVAANLEFALLNGVHLRLANLSGASLRGANLRSSTLIRAFLIGTNLSNTDLSNANLYLANLSNANLNQARLRHTSFSSTDLLYADLSEADLQFANLNDANLNGANLYRAIVGATVFAHLDLRQVTGLLEIIYRSASHLELHTVQLPPGESALPFLRGTGVSDAWIDLYRSQMTHPIQYHSCFISYSSKDEALARRLHVDLQAQGVRCWFAPENLKIGDKFRMRIDEAIHLHEKLLLILSEHSVESTWVENEVETAFEKEAREKRLVLFPIRIDESVVTTGQAWAAQIRRTRHIGDFIHWTDTSAYKMAFELLLRDLKKSF